MPMSEVVKSRLVEEGLWLTFLLHREVSKVEGFKGPKADGYNVSQVEKFNREWPEYAGFKWNDVKKAGVKIKDEYRKIEAAKVEAEVREVEVAKAVGAKTAKVKKVVGGEAAVGGEVKDVEDIGDSEEIRKALLWVFHNVARDDPDFGNAPNAGAIGLWKWIKDSKDGMTDFYTKMLPKVIPTKIEEKRDGLPNDRAYDLVALGDLVGREMEKYGIRLRDGAKGHGDESSVSGFPVELGAPGQR